MRKIACCFIIFVLLFGLFMVGCQQEKVPKAFYPRSAHEAYAHSLEQANLHTTALGKDWIRAGQESLGKALSITLPFLESFYWDPGKAEASAYRFLVKRGVRVEVELTIPSKDSILLFADLYRERGDTVIQRIHVATAGEDKHRLEFEPRRDAYYVLRVQPELLRGGKFKLLIREVPSIGFPVKGKNSRSIASFFGDPRDGGKRDHHGVDIFAPRHTQVLAPSKSSVTRVGEGDIGGTYLWLYDAKRSLYLYFAHLETRDVELGDQIRPGQVIGTVGNSGNARSTAPHLHFGIYRNGPIDPFSFIAETDTIPEKINGDELFLGKMAQTNSNIITRNTPSLASLHLDTLQVNSVVRIKGITARNYRIELPDGSSAYIAGDKVDLMD